MSFTNINDPAGVKALLDQLRVSQAWQDITVPPAPESGTSTNSDETDSTVPSPPVASTSTSTSNSASVASLLSLLQASSPPAAPSVAPSEAQQTRDVGWPNVPSQNDPASLLPVTASSSPRKKDTRAYTFQQALPHIAHLADDPAFVDAIKKMKQEQDIVEKQLWEDRQAIHKKYEEKVKVAATKATMIGGGKVSKHEADMMNAAFKKDLEKFDRERVLLAWDGVISKQQATLASHGVPTMFVTTEGTDRERQQRVMQVLEGII